MSEQACWKKPYLTWAHAANDARTINRAGKTCSADRYAEPYRCPHCHAIHVGTREQGSTRDNSNGLRYRPKAKQRNKRVRVDDE